MTTSQTNPNRLPGPLCQDFSRTLFLWLLPTTDVYVKRAILPPYAAADFPSELFLLPRVLEENSAYRGHFARMRMNSCTYAGARFSRRVPASVAAKARAVLPVTVPAAHDGFLRGLSERALNVR